MVNELSFLLMAVKEKYNLTNRDIARIVEKQEQQVGGGYVNGKHIPRESTKKEIIKKLKEYGCDMDNLRKNAEGYSDPTAYKALRNVGATKDVYKGDVFYVEKADGYGSNPAIIVSDNAFNECSEYVMVVFLSLNDTEPKETHVSVKCKQDAIAVCEKVFTVRKNRIGDYIKRCADEEMESIEGALIVALGLEAKEHCDSDDARIVADLKRKLNELECEKDKQLEEKQNLLEDANRNCMLAVAKLNESSNSDSEYNNKEIVKLRLKCELLEEQNEKLLNRLIG